MTFIEFKDKVESLVATDEVAEAFDLLFDHVRIGVIVNSKTISLIKGNWTGAQRQFREGIIDHIELSKITAKTRDAILGLLEDVLKRDFDATRSPEKVAANLVVLSPNLSSEAAMNIFFPFEYFRQVDFTNDETWQQLIEASDLVIFDNYAHPGVQVEDEIRKIQLAKLTWLLNYTDRCVVWFGSFNELVSQNPDGIYAANSPFALYARVREMLEFLKYMSAKAAEKPD